MIRRVATVIVSCRIILGTCSVLPQSQTEEKRATSPQEIVVTASRIETLLHNTPDIVQVVDRKTIAQLHPAGTGELVDYVTGVSMSTGTGAGFPSRSVLSVNGLPTRYTLVLVDGVPLLTDHIHTGVNVDHIPPSSIERIEIMRGAASAQYGTDAIGGIVYVTRRATDRPEGSLEVLWDSQNTYGGNISLLTPAGKKVRISSFLGWQQSDGPDIKAPINRIGQMGYERMNLLARLDATPAEGTRVASWLNWVRNRMDWTPDRADSHFVSPALELAQE